MSVGDEMMRSQGSLPLAGIQAGDAWWPYVPFTLSTSNSLLSSAAAQYDKM